MKSIMDIKEPASLPPGRDNYITNNQGDNPMNTSYNRTLDDTVKALKVSAALYKAGLTIQEARGMDNDSIHSLLPEDFQKRKTRVAEFNESLDLLEELQESDIEFNEQLDDYDTYSYTVDTMNNVTLYNNYEGKSIYLQNEDAADFISRLDSVNDRTGEYELIASYDSLMESITIESLVENLSKHRS